MMLEEVLYSSIEYNRIYIADVFEFLKILPDNSIDLAIIDPPYNLKIADWDTFKSEKDFLDFSIAWIDAFLPKLKITSSFYIFNTPYNSALFINYLSSKNVVFQNFITWYKKDGLSYSKRRYNNNQETILFYTVDKKHYYFDYDSIRIPYLSTERMKHASKKGILKSGKRWYPNQNGRLCPDVWEITSERHKRKVCGKTIKLNHPTPKPSEMIERMIKASSKKNDVILDLFAGTGTTSLVAHALNRNFIGCEKCKEYLDEYIRTN